MSNAAKMESAPSQSFGVALGHIWSDLLSLPELSDEDAFPPKPVDIEKIAKNVIASETLNGSTEDFSALVDSVKASRWLTSSESRFVIGAALADQLANQALEKCTAQPAGTGSAELPEAACAAISKAIGKLPESDRSTILGAMMLAPETRFRLVARLFSDNVSMVSSIFSIPLEAAKLRVSFDRPID